MNKLIYHGIRRHIFRHIIRAKVKSILVILVALGIFLTLGWLQETINRNEIEINRLYETANVFGQIVPSDSGVMIQNREGGDLIRRRTVDAILTSDLVKDIYFESSSPWALVTNLVDDSTFLAEILDEIVGYDNDFDARQHREFLDQVIAIEHLELFIERHTFEPTAQIPGVGLVVTDIEIEFALGFNQASFVYADESLETPVPVILSEDIMMQNGFEFGDIVSIGYNLNRSPASWEKMTAVIIGLHSQTAMSWTVLLPLSAWEFALGDTIGFTTLDFIVDPMLNSELPSVRERIEEIVTHAGAGFTPLMLDLHDEEIRFVVQTMEENVSLLRLLYPVVVVVSMMIAIALSFFLTLQSAKNVAVMRIFGATRERVGLILWIEQVILCICGLTLGLCLLIALSWGFGVLALFGIAGLYLFGIMIGSAIGIFIITRHAPLELLQVKE